MDFVKMHGCGNDYIYFDCLADADATLQNKIIPHIPHLSDRHFGVGGDGVVMICPSKVATAKMRMFNADGSEGKMCGNASRCVGKFLFDNGYVKGDALSIETLSGIKYITLDVRGGVAVGATVNMGMPELTPCKVPVDVSLLSDAFKSQSKLVAMPMSVGGVDYTVTAVSMGNPHCVTFVEQDVSDIPLDKIGPLFESNPLFPERVNTEFVNVVGDNQLKMRVWERGSGETLACGTGSSATAVAAVQNGLCDGARPIVVHLVGGDLTIQIKDDGVYMSGPAEVSFYGSANF